MVIFPHIVVRKKSLKPPPSFFLKRHNQPKATPLDLKRLQGTFLGKKNNNNNKLKRQKSWELAFGPTPLKINMEHIIMKVWKIIFLSKWVICMFHVNLPGCKRSITRFLLWVFPRVKPKKGVKFWPPGSHEVLVSTGLPQHYLISKKSPTGPTVSGPRKNLSI